MQFRILCLCLGQRIRPFHCALFDFHYENYITSILIFQSKLLIHAHFLSKNYLKYINIYILMTPIQTSGHGNDESGFRDGVMYK